MGQGMITVVLIELRGCENKKGMENKRISLHRWKTEEDAHVFNGTAELQPRFLASQCLLPSQDLPSREPHA